MNVAIPLVVLGRWWTCLSKPVCIHIDIPPFTGQNRPTWLTRLQPRYDIYNYIYIPGTYYIVLLGGSEGAKELCAMGTVSILFRISIRSKERFKTFPWNPRYPGKKHGTVPATNPLKPSCFPWKSMISLSVRWQFLTQRHDALRLPWPREDSRRPRDPAAAWWTKLGSCGTSPRGYQWSYSNPKIARTIQSYEAIDKINK